VCFPCSFTPFGYGGGLTDPIKTMRNPRRYGQLMSGGYNFGGWLFMQ